MFLRMRFSIAALLLATVSGLAPLLMRAEIPPPPLPERPVEVTIRQGLDSLALGFPRTAIERLGPAFREPGLPAATRQEILLALLSAHIHLNEPQAGLEWLSTWEQPLTPPILLRQAILFYLGGNAFRARLIAERIATAELPPEEEAWAKLLHGLLLDRRGQIDEAGSLYARARELAATEDLRRQIEAIIARQEILKGEATVEMATALRNQLEVTTAPALRAQLAREYAVVLSLLDRGTEAIEFLNLELSNLPPAQARERSSLLLLVGILNDPSTPAGRARLWDVLKITPDIRLGDLALTLLQNHAPTNPRTAMDNIDQLLESRPDFLLADRLLFFKAQLLQQTDQPTEAEQALRLLESRFPASPLIRESLLMRAWLAFNAHPPQYRSAASLLIEALPLVNDPTRRRHLNLLAGDLHFLNGDYPVASQIYRGVLEGNALQTGKSTVVLRLLECHLNLQEFTEAAALLDQHTSLLSTEDRWRGEWNLALHQMRHGHSSTARERLASIDADGQAEEMTPRLIWLGAYLAGAEGDEARALAILDPLLNADPGTLTEAKLAVVPFGWLLAAEIKLRLGDIAEADRFFSILRERYPEEKAATLSYLVEARALAARDLSADAQQRLVTLADRFPRDSFAAVALFEAAIIAESRATAETIQVALRLLDDLATRFPDDPLAFQARLRQGNIFRQQGDFETARLFFENTLRQFPGHPLEYRAEIGRADCILANPNASANLLRDAAAAFERVAVLPEASPSARLEATYKQALALERLGENKAATDLLWETILPLLQEEAPAVLADGSSRTWLSRALLTYGKWRLRDGSVIDARQAFEQVERLNLPGREIARAENRRLTLPSPPESAQTSP